MLFLYLSFTLSLSQIHRVMSCLQKAETNDGLCVVCAHSAAPWPHFTHPAENRPLCLSLSLPLSMYLSLSCSRCLPTFFGLWRIELFCCALPYILPTVYIVFSWGLTTDIRGQQCFWLTPAFHIYRQMKQ